MQFIDGTGGRAPAGGSSGGGPAALGRQGGGAAGTAGRSASPSNGGGVPSAGLGAYQALLKRIIEAHKEYPLAARRMRQEGSCLRRFTISRGGSLKKVEPLSSCGHPFLDDAATRAITGAGTFPPLPDDFRGEEATFTISIKFTLENE
jgi:protein TonB